MTSSDKARPQLHIKMTLQLYLSATWRHKRDSLLSLLLIVSNVLLGVLTPFFASKLLADIVTHNHDLWPEFSWFVSVAITGVLLNTIGIRYCMKLQARVMQELNDHMFSKLLERSVGFFNNQVGGKSHLMASYSTPAISTVSLSWLRRSSVCYWYYSATG